jgi:hypothetical protein
VAEIETELVFEIVICRERMRFSSLVLLLVARIVPFCSCLDGRNPGNRSAIHD